MTVEPENKPRSSWGFRLLSFICVANLVIFFMKHIFMKHILYNSSEFPNERIPSLEETVETCVNLGLQMFIDVKTGTQATQVSHNVFCCYTCTFLKKHNSGVHISGQ